MIYLKEGQNQIYTASPQPGEYQRRGNPGIPKWGEETAMMMMMNTKIMKIYTASPKPGEYQRRGNPGVCQKGEETATVILLMMMIIYTASPLPGEYQRRGNQGDLLEGEETAMILLMGTFTPWEEKNTQAISELTIDSHS